ncbi:hypothetical protein [Mesorhizobium sp. M1396]|uniref:hypothetical protein n=1 Tax=Mesorhizobium sp. M1396 TaxID=2957095 RepID=UPI00333C3CD8
MSQRWLITGSSRGIGRALSEAVLTAGVVWWRPHACPRIWPSAERYGNAVRAAALDVTDPAAAQTAILRLSPRWIVRLPLGSDAVKIIGQADTARLEELERWRELSVSTDFPPTGNAAQVQFKETPEHLRSSPASITIKPHQSRSSKGYV